MTGGVFRLSCGVFLFGGKFFGAQTLDFFGVFRLQSLALGARFFGKALKFRLSFLGARGFRRLFRFRPLYLGLFFGFESFEFRLSFRFNAFELGSLFGLQSFALGARLFGKTFEFGSLFFFEPCYFGLFFFFGAFEFGGFFRRDAFEFRLFLRFDTLYFRLLLSLDAIVFFLRNRARAAFRREPLRFFFGDLVAVRVYVDLFFDEHHLFLFAVDDLRLVGIVLLGVRAQIVGVEWSRRGVEVELSCGHELVENGARILVLGALLLKEAPAFGGERIVTPSAAAGVVWIAVVGGDQPLFFQPFELVVKGGLFEFVLTFALGFDLFQNVVAVAVPVPERA